MTRMTDDPRWRRGEGGWWYWNDAGQWQWVADPPPAPDPSYVPPAAQPQPSTVYVQAAPKRRRWPWVAACLVLLMVAIAAVAEQGPDTSATLANADQRSASAPVRANGFPLQDGDWRLDSLTVSKEEFSGDFTGKGKVTYTGSDKGGGDTLLEITIYTGTNNVASMSTTIDNVPPGFSKTVEFFSTDDHVVGDHRFTFEAGWF